MNTITPWKINGWNLKFTQVKSGKSSKPPWLCVPCEIFQGVFVSDDLSSDWLVASWDCLGFPRVILHGFHGFLVMKGNYPILYLPMLISAVWEKFPFILTAIFIWGGACFYQRVLWDESNSNHKNHSHWGWYCPRWRLTLEPQNWWFGRCFSFSVRRYFLRFRIPKIMVFSNMYLLHVFFRTKFLWLRKRKYIITHRICVYICVYIYIYM